MKRQVTLVIAFLALLCSGAAAWLSHYYAEDLTRRRIALQKELINAKAREKFAALDRRKFEDLDAIAKKITERVEWGTDPTYVLRWFADTADEVGVRLAHSQVMTLRSGKNIVGEKKLRRTQYSLRLNGTYAALVSYTEHVERSPYMMLVEKLSMSSRRSGGDDGELRLTVSSLCPVGLKPEPENPIEQETEQKRETGDAS